MSKEPDPLAVGRTEAVSEVRRAEGTDSGRTQPPCLQPQSEDPLQPSIVPTDGDQEGRASSPERP